MPVGTARPAFAWCRQLSDVDPMPNPVVVTIPHRLGKEEAKRRIQRQLGEIRSRVAPYVSSLQDDWIGDCLVLRAVALGQAVTAQIDVLEDFLRIEVDLPGILGWIGGMVADQVRRVGAALLAKPDI